MQLEVGKYYKSKEGDIYKVVNIVKENDSSFPVFMEDKNGTKYSCSINGEYYGPDSPSGQDLVEESNAEDFLFQESIPVIEMSGYIQHEEPVVIGHIAPGETVTEENINNMVAQHFKTKENVLIEMPKVDAVYTTLADIIVQLEMLPTKDRVDCLAFINTKFGE